METGRTAPLVPNSIPTQHSTARNVPAMKVHAEPEVHHEPSVHDVLKARVRMLEDGLSTLLCLPRFT